MRQAAAELFSRPAFYWALAGIFWLRVVVLSAGPATHPIGEFPIDLPRPRDVAEIRLSPRFVELHEAIWHVLKSEVLKGYAQGKR